MTQHNIDFLGIVLLALSQRGRKLNLVSLNLGFNIW